MSLTPSHVRRPPATLSGHLTTTRRRLAAGIASLTIALSGVAAAEAPTASAANGCTGSLIEVSPIWFSLDGVHNTRFGELQIYYDSAKGKNCVSMVHGGPTWGKQLRTHAEVRVCDRDPGGGCRFYGPAGVDDGYYSYYANAWTPVSSKGRRGVPDRSLGARARYSGGHVSSVGPA